jgi:tRNA pseudouridine13 synthase
MRLKALPEDFVVEEQIQLPLNPAGKHTIFRVWKREATTLQVQESLAALLHVGKEQIAFPALKDKDAIATQFVSVALAPHAALPAPAPGAAYSFEHVGSASRALQPSDLRGNAFTIVVRDLALGEAQKLGPRLRQLGEFGLPNYFDEQRFGSYSGASGFIGKTILKRDAEGALRIYLAEKMAGDPERVRVFKEYASEHWGDWGALMEHAPRPSNFRSVLTYLKDHPADGYRKALNLIPHRLLALYLSAYQSWLWNLIAGRFITSIVAEHHFATPMVRVAGRDLPAYYNLPESLRLSFDRLNIPLPNHRAVYADPALAGIVSEIMAGEGLSLNDFKARILKKAFAAKSSRPLIVHPTDIQSGEPENDELARKRWKIKLRFTLPPGSYATMVVKAAFARWNGETTSVV